jgi:hypothetical protein
MCECPTHYLLPLTLHCLNRSGLQSDEQCCNSCEEVREAYKKKGWALTNPDLIDQVNQSFSIFLPGFVHCLVYIELSFGKTTSTILCSSGITILDFLRP